MLGCNEAIDYLDLQAVAFQRIMKMGVIASGEFGKGFVLAKVPASNGLGWQWSAPAFYSLVGGSLGLTTGMPF